MRPVRQRRSRLAAAVAAAAVLGGIVLVVAMVACGDDKGAAEMKEAREVIGHDPAGLAEDIFERGTLVVANDADYPPQSSIDAKTKELKGFDVDVARRVAELLGVKAEFVNPNWDAIAEGLSTDRFDVNIGSLAPTPAAAKLMAFSDPYYYATAQIVVPAGVPKLTEPDELKSKRVGVAAQTSYQVYLQSADGVRVVPFTSDSDAVEALAGGEVEALLMSDLSARAEANQGEKIQLSGKPLFYQPLVFALRKEEPDLLALLNAAIRSMRDDGDLTEMSKRWYGGYDASKRPPDGVPTFDEAMKAK